MSKEMEDLTALEELANSVPVELLYAPNTPMFNDIDFGAQGSWAPITKGSEEIGIVWTDWNGGAGYMSKIYDDGTRSIRDYFSSAKQMGMNAGTAFSTLRIYLQNHLNEFAMGEQQSGTLDGALNSLQNQNGESKVNDNAE